jgi:hypothetical protein
MAAKFKMAAKTKFAFKNYKSYFFKKRIQGCFSCLSFFSQKFKMAPMFNIEIFLASFSRSSHIRQEFSNGEIFEEETKKK